MARPVLYDLLYLVAVTSVLALSTTKVEAAGGPARPVRSCRHPGRPRDGISEPSRAAAPLLSPGDSVSFECNDQWFELDGAKKVTCLPVENLH